MAYTTKDMSGSAFLEDADKVAENPNRPKWTGKVMAHGKLMRIAVWEKDDGRLSFALKDWEERPRAAGDETEGEEPEADSVPTPAPSLFSKPKR